MQFSNAIGCLALRNNRCILINQSFPHVLTGGENYNCKLRKCQRRGRVNQKWRRRQTSDARSLSMASVVLQDTWATNVVLGWRRLVTTGTHGSAVWGYVVSVYASLPLSGPAASRVSRHATNLLDMRRVDLWEAGFRLRSRNDTKTLETEDRGSGGDTARTDCSICPRLFKKTKPCIITIIFIIITVITNTYQTVLLVPPWSLWDEGCICPIRSTLQIFWCVLVSINHQLLLPQYCGWFVSA